MFQLKKQRSSAYTPSENSIYLSITEKIFLTLWTGICFLAISYHPDAIPPYHTDERYYIESVRTMLETGEYLTPYYHEKKRFAKPILTYLLMAAVYKAF